MLEAKRRLSNPRRSAAAFALVADVRRPAAAALRAIAVRARGAARRVRRLEAQAAAHRIGLGEPQRQPLAECIGLAALLADQALACFVVAIIVLAERCGRDQPVAAQRLDRGEEAERLDAGDPAFDQGADLIR